MVYAIALFVCIEFIPYLFFPYWFSTQLVLHLTPLQSVNGLRLELITLVTNKASTP